MKKILLIMFTLSALLVNAQTISNGCDSLETIYNLGTSNNGAMFTVSAKKKIQLNYFYGNMDKGSYYATIYYKQGSYIGFENSPSAWTLLDSAYLTSNSDGFKIKNIPTKIPININLKMNQGDIYSFYIMNPSISKMLFTIGKTEGAIYKSDSSLTLYEGTSIFKSYGVKSNTPRIFNGTLVYCSVPVGVDEVVEKAKFNIVSLHNELRFQVDERLFENKNTTILIRDILSRPVASEKITADNVSLNTESFAKGMYVCTLLTGNTVVEQKKIIIQ